VPRKDPAAIAVPAFPVGRVRIVAEHERSLVRFEFCESLLDIKIRTPHVVDAEHAQSADDGRLIP
jgi:hypothetical protein